MDAQNKFYVIGIDGGGTKTEAVLLDSERNIVGTGIGGSVNATYAGADVANQSVHDAFAGVCSSCSCFDEVAAVGSCLHHGWHKMKAILAEQGYSGPYYTFSETMVAFRRVGAWGMRGIAVISGTGSGFRYFDGQRECDNLGGWGAGVGDEGSAFDIGLNAIKAAGRAHDGRGPKTVLVERLLEQTGSTYFWHILSKYCQPSLRQREIAGLARVVGQAAVDGDSVALRILADAGKSLGEDTLHIARRVFSADDQFVVAYSGGVFSAGAFITETLERVVRAEFPMAEFRLPQMGAGVAVAHLTNERFLS